jgi:hypothetical protein
MTISVKHKFVSTIPDSLDTSLVRPTNWNDDHDLTGLGTMAEQNANAVAITGGTISTTTLTSDTVSNNLNFTPTTAPSYQEGRVWYDSTEKALAFYNDSSTIAVHVGQDLIVKVINNTGSTIPNGSPVYVTSVSSGQTYPNVALAKADVAATASVIGLTNGAIPNGAFGYVTSQGTIDNVNTSTYTVGQVLYLSPYSAGQLMNTVPPTGITVQVGVVTYVNSTTGHIYVKQTIPLSIVSSFSAGTTGFTPNTATSGAVTLAGTLNVANGGTGATTASGARTNLGLGTMATQDANNVAITGGTIAGDGSGLTGTAPNLTVGNANAAQQLRTLASNGEGVLIPAGKVVYLNPNGTKLDVKLADATTYDKSQVVGVTATDIPVVGTGWVTMQGFVSGLDTSAYQYGQILYLSGTTPGELSATEPVSPLYAVHVCYVMTVNATTGTIFVNPINHSVNDDYFIGLLKINHGGTNSSATPTAGAIAYGTGTAYAFTSAGTSGQTLLSNGASAPTWGTPAGSLTITDDTTTNSAFYPTFTSATTGTITGETVSSTRFSYNPSTGSITTYGDAFFNGMRVGHGAANVTSNSVVGADSLSVATGGANNTAMGYQSLKSVTTGSNLTAYGYQAGYSATTSAEFSAFGYLAGYANTTGHGLSAFGFGAGAANTTGSYNSYFGGHAGQNNVGEYNTVVGGLAFYLTTSGNSNTIIGSLSAESNQLQNNNTALGFSTLRASTGSGNVVIGSYSGLYETGSNAFYLNNQDRTNTAGDKASSLMYGTFNATASSQTLKINGVVTASYALTALGGIAGGTF